MGSKQLNWLDSEEPLGEPLGGGGGARSATTSETKEPKASFFWVYPGESARGSYLEAHRSMESGWTRLRDATVHGDQAFSARSTEDAEAYGEKEAEALIEAAYALERAARVCRRRADLLRAEVLYFVEDMRHER